MKEIVEAYLKEMGVPSKYIEMMFQVPKDEIRWLTKTELRADFPILIPELQDWVESKCRKQPVSPYNKSGGRRRGSEQEIEQWRKDIDKYFECRDTAMEEMRLRVWFKRSKSKEQ